MNITAEQLNAYTWYHRIEIAPGLVTQPANAYPISWELIETNLSKLDLAGKTVLDIGTRDGKWAFMAERMGASVFAIDNNQSPGALFLREHLQSRVRFLERNLLDPAPLPSDWPDTFDVVFLFGVLYHLRYPMLGLRRVCQRVKSGGLLCAETALWDWRPADEMPLLYCPSLASPYEPTSCSFFNLRGLVETLGSFGMTHTASQYHPAQAEEPIKRYWFGARKTHDIQEPLAGYWENTHKSHNL